MVLMIYRVSGYILKTVKRHTILTGTAAVLLFFCTGLKIIAHDRLERNTYASAGYFYIEEIERENGEIEIEFNIPADPRSVRPECVIIDGKPLTKDELSVKFSRRGDKIVITELPQWKNKVIGIRLSGIRAADGTVLEELPPVFIDEDQEYEREDDLEYVYWYWYDTHGGKPFTE